MLGVRFGKRKAGGCLLPPIINVLRPDTLLYTTIAFYNEILGGNLTWVERILSLDGTTKAVHVGLPRARPVYPAQ